MYPSRFTKSISIALISSLIACLYPVHANDLSISPMLPEQSESGKDPVSGEILDENLDFASQVRITDYQKFDIWERIRKGFAIPELDNPLVATHTTWYSARPEYMQRTTQRASRYLFHVLQELEKRQMPTELALLPFIESSFNPQAYSRAKAAGMWQFIPSTGRDYNLKQNVFRDERRDVIASTDAALTYLQKLHGMFGDWQLALAAYNWGEGSVSRAIAKARAAGRPTDFNSLSDYMPSETRNYYPKLQAVKNIIAAPMNYGIKLPVVENEPYFVSINKTRDIDIKLAAQLAELPLEEFRALNPQFNRPVITGSPTTNILLPQLNAEKFRENLGKWKQALSSWTAHRVTAARERIETIAAKFKTTPQVIREANEIPPNMHPKAGSTILVPKLASAGDHDIADEIVDNSVMSVEPDEPPRKRITIKVGKRDDIKSIARRYKVTEAQIREWNDLKSGKLSAGQSLIVEVRTGKGKKAKASKSGAAEGKHKSARKKAEKSSKEPARRARHKAH